MHSPSWGVTRRYNCCHFYLTVGSCYPAFMPRLCHNMVTRRQCDVLIDYCGRLFKVDCCNARGIQLHVKISPLRCLNVGGTWLMLLSAWLRLIPHWSWCQSGFFLPIRRCGSTVLAMVLSLSLCPFVRHKPVLYQNGWMGWAYFWHKGFPQLILHCVGRELRYLQK